MAGTGALDEDEIPPPDRIVGGRGRAEVVLSDRGCPPDALREAPRI